MIKKIILTLLIGHALSNDMTPPDIPQILGVSYDGKIVLTWNKIAEESIDFKTGYSDFEGYRLYKSTDGGQTWGDLDTDIIPVDTDGDGIGEIVGWRPIVRFDLTELEDTTRCVYYNEYENCQDDPETNMDESLERKVNISGSDPVSPWFYLGDNTGLNHFYEDEDVINGVEYTYAITAYDMGVKIDTVVINNIDDIITLDTTWNASNPGHFTCPDGWQCPSFESPKFSESFTDYNSNGVWDEEEPFTDANPNSHYDSCEEFIDMGNCIWDSEGCSNENFLNEEICLEAGHEWTIVTEDFIDCNSNQSICFGDDSWTDDMGNGVWDEGESFIDTNPNGQYDFCEEFTDTGNCVFDLVRENLINIITISPSATATNISFPSETETESFIVSDDLNLGTGQGLYRLVDEASLEPKIIKMEIQADGDEDDFESFKTRNPELYIYEVDENQDLLIGNYASYNINELEPEEVDDYSDMPGSRYSSDSTQIHVPAYIINPLPIMFSDQTGAENNYTQWFSGIQVRFDNYLFELPQTNSYAGINNISYMNIDGADYEEDLNDNGLPDNFEDLDDDNDLTLAWYLGEYDTPGNFYSNSGGKIQLSYWGDGFDARSMFDYKIEFSATQNLDTAYRVIPNGDTCFDITLSTPDWDGDRDEVSFLPVKITNMTTGRQVRSWHTDKGVYTGDGGSPSSDDPGYGDCIWEHNETISFTHDSLTFSGDLNASGDCIEFNEDCTPFDDLDEDNCCWDGEKTFELIIEYSMPALRIKYGADLFEGFPEWEEEGFYTTSTIIEHAESMWQTKRDIDPATEVYPESCSGICSPNSIYDNDGDLVNDNPWQQLYPWDEGDYIIVSPDKWFQDGDNWTANLSLLGAQQELNNSHINSIMVLPNPYIVSSVYNEELYDNRLKFDNLPNQCAINIYTATGEHVSTINHDDTGDMANWDMKNMNGNLVSPGLYIYTVEAGTLDPVIGKFVIIK